MHERIDQLSLGLKFESKPTLQAASESVLRQYLREYGSGEVNWESWEKIAETHPAHSHMIRRFMALEYTSWNLQSNAQEDDPRFQAMEAVRNSQRTRSSSKSTEAYIAEAININFVEDLLWMRTSLYDSSIHSSYLIEDELDSIYGQITPAAILEDDLGNVEFPNLSSFPLQNLIEKVLKNEIFMDSPAFYGAE